MIVKLYYFKRETGRYYTTGEYTTSATTFYDLEQELRDLVHSDNNLPGMSTTAEHYFVTLDLESVKDLENVYPLLLFRR